MSLALCLGAGRGQRFRDAGFDIPKPLIRFRNQYFFELALSGLPEDWPRSLVLLKENFLMYKAELDIIPVAVRTLDKPTRGPAETALQALSPGDQGSIVLIDCDMMFRAPAEFWKITAADFHVLTFHSKSSKFCYVLLEDAGRVRDIAEKDAISSHAVAGVYLFRDLNLFKNWAKAGLSQAQSAEVFVSHIIKHGLALGARGRAFPADEHISLGTPNELFSAEGCT